MNTNARILEPRSRERSVASNRRLGVRLLRHHVPLGLLATGVALALYFTRPYPDVISRASFATAYPALGLLAATLLIGPWNLLRKQRNPVSMDLRRDVGIWAGIYGVAHTAIGQCVHLRGRPWLYYVYGPWEHHHTIPIRHDLFGMSNYTGVAAVLLLVALLATSNDYSLRALGTPRWKKLQRWNYAIFALTAIHAVGYMTIEKQKKDFVITVVVLLAISLVFQAVGFTLRRRRAAEAG